MAAGLKSQLVSALDTCCRHIDARQGCHERTRSVEPGLTAAGAGATQASHRPVVPGTELRLHKDMHTRSICLALPYLEAPFRAQIVVI